MSQTVTERVRQLESSEAAEFLVSQTSSRHVDPFIRRECSLTEAAKALGISKNRMNYWLNKMLELGLIEQLRVEKRGKHNVPIYRATADVFTVPALYIPAYSSEEVLKLHAKGFAEAEQRSVIHQGLKQDQDWNLEYRLLRDRSDRSFKPGAGGPLSFVHSFGNIYLTDEVAEAAKQELQEFIRRYNALSNPKGKSYLVKFLMVEEAPS
jgi:DNA-binding transcriptional ArsR family regulator